MTRKTTLYIGLNDKDTKRQEIETIEAYKIASQILANETGGGTIYAADGIYKHDNGDIVIEKTLRIEIFAASDESIANVITLLKKLLNQESVIKQTETVESVFC